MRVKKSVAALDEADVESQASRWARHSRSFARTPLMRFGALGRCARNSTSGASLVGELAADGFMITGGQVGEFHLAGVNARVNGSVTVDDFG